MANVIRIEDIAQHIGEQVTLQGCRYPQRLAGVGLASFFWRGAERRERDGLSRDFMVTLRMP